MTRCRWCGESVDGVCETCRRIAEAHKLGRDDENRLPLWERMRREVAAADRLRPRSKGEVQGDLFAEYQS